MQASEDAVGWIEELEASDAHLVSAFRNAAVALGHDRDELWADVEHELAHIGEARTASAALAPFTRLMRTIGRHGRGQIRFHRPGCPCLGADEMTFLWLVRHARAGAAEAAIRDAGELVEHGMAGTLVAQASLFDAALGAVPGDPQFASGAPMGPPSPIRVH